MTTRQILIAMIALALTFLVGLCLIGAIADDMGRVGQGPVNGPGGHAEPRSVPAETEMRHGRQAP